MTLETCERLLKHFEKLGNKEQVEVYKARVELKRKFLPKAPPNKKFK